jgi:hypothetical protein
VLHKSLNNFFFNVFMLVICVLSVFSISYAQGSDAIANEPISMLAFSIGLAGMGFLIRRQLRR